jgi:hypothetical protein
MVAYAATSSFPAPLTLDQLLLFNLSMATIKKVDLVAGEKWFNNMHIGILCREGGDPVRYGTI